MRLKIICGACKGREYDVPGDAKKEDRFDIYIPRYKGMASYPLKAGVNGEDATKLKHRIEQVCTERLVFTFLVPHNWSGDEVMTSVLGVHGMLLKPL